MTINAREFERFLSNLYTSARISGLDGQYSQPGENAASTPFEETRAAEIFRFGPFRLFAEIGRGGFGIVYLARDERIGRDIALKLPMPYVLLSESARNRFLREGRVGETLNHSGIVKVHETGEFGGIAYIASEYVPGPTLSNWLTDRKAPVSPTLAATLVSMIAEALAHAHEHGVIHRDLKPANIILRPVGNPGDSIADSVCPYRPCVTDFGLAKVLHEIRNEQTMTGSGEIGSTAFMAPEQALGQNDRIGPWTDIHALGAILYRIMSGRTPFTGETREEVIRKIVNEQPPSLRTIRSDVPENLETICDKCLRKEPGKRYASALELKSDLDRFLARERILARPIPVREKGIRWIRRHPAITVAAISAFGCMCLIIAMQAIQNRNLNKLVRNLVISERRAAEQARLADLRKAIVDQAYFETRLKSAESLVKNRQDELAQRLLMEIDPGPGDRDFAWNHLWRRSREEMEVIALAGADMKRLSLSPDGKSVVTHDKASTLIMRDTGNGAELDRFEIGRDPKPAFWFSRDGRKVFCVESVPVSALSGSELRYVFTARENGSSRTAILQKSGTKLGSAFVESATGDRILFTTYDTSTAKWKVQGLSLDEMRFVDVVPAMESGFVAMAPNGRFAIVRDSSDMLISKSIDDDSIEIPLVPVEEVLPESIAFDRGSTKIAILGKNRRTVRILGTDPEFDSNPVMFDLPLQAQWCLWIDQAKRLLIYDNRWNAALIDARTGSSVPLRPIENSEPIAFGFHPRVPVEILELGSRLFTYGYSRDPGGRMGQLWNSNDGRELPFRFQDYVADTRRMPDGHSAMMLTNRFLKRWWPEARSLSNRNLAGHADEAWGASFAPDGTTLATSSDDTDDPMTVRIWNWKTGELIRGFAAHKATVSCVEFSPDGRLFATCALSSEGNLALWDSKSGRKVADLEGHSTSIYNLAFSSDGSRLVSGDNNGQVIVWDIAKFEPVAKIQADSDRIRGLSFLPGSQSVVATASESRHVRIWETSENRILREWIAEGEMTTLAFVPGKSQLCAAEANGRLFLWDITTGALIRSIESVGNRIRHMRFLKDSPLLAAGDVKGRLHLWNVENGIEILDFEGHETPINRVACAVDSKTLCTVAHDGSVRLWFGGDIRDEMGPFVPPLANTPRNR